jgi:hypothetical protein
MTTLLKLVVRGGCSFLVFLMFVAGFVLSAAAQKTSDADSTAANLLRAALSCELAGRNDDRRVLLMEARAQSPHNAAVRWQLGEVRDGNANVWLTTSQVEEAAHKDNRLAEYRAKRDAAGSALDEQVALAHWCRKNKLVDEERVHWLAVLQEQPTNPEAAERLKLQRPVGGTLLTPEQVAQFDEHKRKFHKSLQYWWSLAAPWQKLLEAGETAPPAEMRDRVANVSEPSEMLALEKVFWQAAGSKKSRQHTVALALAEMLRDNPHPAAAKCLATMAAGSDWDDVRGASIQGLKQHPFDHYVPLLLSRLQTLLVTDARFDVNVSGYLITRFSVFREGAFADFESLSLDSPDAVNRFGPVVDADSPASVWERQLPLRLTASQRAWVLAETQIRLNLANAQTEAANREAALGNAVANTNRAISARNARIVAVLNQATGLGLGEEPMKWWTWWWEGFNDTYDVSSQIDKTAGATANTYVMAPYVSDASYKPIYRSDVVNKYAMQLPSRYSSLAGHSCFAPGTMVWTQLGRRPIEEVKAGDRVLAQNVDTGELAYKPVAATTVRRPGPRIKIGVGKETITATPSHPFWVNGKNWQLTKQLEVGCRLHSVSGAAAVDSLEIVETDPSRAGYSYNLIVADFHSYFVGEQGVLVHDNTPRQPTSAVVPGLRPDAATASGSTVESR